MSVPPAGVTVGAFLRGRVDEQLRQVTPAPVDREPEDEVDIRDEAEEGEA